ncbi:hypothetical protein [Rhodoferax sp. U11-2br]|uniref:hypothetical protein n=1 Tax=Rhodoferax sp. U11-2br TaxID=2838878 RepID=UPI001BE7B77D|nr:hypothetical protein [Rhodoferax sp. U11-2br]MBT3066269.1 hypothetical protein [Rhodoferax sp. U11-2br]
MGSENNPKFSEFPNEEPRILALPKGPDSWRIDWLGDIAYPNRFDRRKQPSVFVHLSKVADERFRSDPSVLLSPESTTHAQFQKRAWISIGTLPLLRVGDIWRDGQLDARPDYEMEEFKNIQIDAKTTTLIKAGLNIDDAGFLLPLAEHPWHMQCTQSYCIMVNLPDGKRLIIPCMELIRFYFGSSSNLLSKLFLPPLKRATLYSHASFDARSKYLFLQLSEKISGASAADIGRLHLSPLAWRAAALVGTSILKASVAQQPIYPQALFPFEGETTLVAAGKWLSFAGQPRSTFLAYNLRSCNHPFPFRSLSYKITASLIKSQQSDGNLDQLRTQPMRATARDAQNQPLIESDASNNLAPRTRNYRIEPRFPDLVPKPIWRCRTLSHTEWREKLDRRRNNSSVSNGAVGDPGSERRIRSVDFALLSKINPSYFEIAPAFLRPIVQELCALQDVTVELLTESNEDGWTVPMSIIANEDGEIHSKQFVQAGSEGARLRRTSAFLLRHYEEKTCLVAIESTPTYFTCHPAIGTMHEEVASVLRRAAMDFLIPKKPNPGSIHDLLTLALRQIGAEVAGNAP